MKDAASTYSRIFAACCKESGLSPEDLETHIRRTTERALDARGQLLPEMKK